MHPQSPEPDFPELAGMPPELVALVAPVLAAAAQVEVEIAEAQQLLARQAAEPEDPEIVAALERASKEPDAPESLRRVAHKISLGRLSWHDVLGASADPGAPVDPDVRELRRDAMTTAREHQDDIEFTPLDDDPDGDNESS